MIKASELVDKLQELIEQHGDLEVMNDCSEEIDVEFSEGGPGQIDGFVIS